MDLVFDDTHEYFLMDDYTINTGNSVIYRANDKKLNRDVAIKKISVTNELALKQAKHEIQVLSKFSNGEVPYIYDYHVQDENLYIIMQWIQGDSLEKKLKRKQVSLKEMTGWMMELCDTLDELAKHHIYHKDIKPSNLMIFNGRLVLIDFNISMSLTNKTEGTFGYKAPEMGQRSKETRRDKVDMFAIGVILYEFYKGSLPQMGDEYSSPSLRSTEKAWKNFVEPIEKYPEMDKKMNEIITRCMKYDPAERYESYSKLRSDLKLVNKRGNNHGRKRSV